jgi:hypothetical protein
MKTELRDSLDRQPRGKNMPKGDGWYLVSPAGKVFKASNRHSENIARYRVAIFRVPKK